jgi:hypothetical protein
LLGELEGSAEISADFDQGIESIGGDAVLGPGEVEGTDEADELVHGERRKGLGGHELPLRSTGLPMQKSFISARICWVLPGRSLIV